MSSNCKLSQIQKKCTFIPISTTTTTTLIKPFMIIAGLMLLLLFCILLPLFNNPSSQFLANYLSKRPKWSLDHTIAAASTTDPAAPTNISHIVFGIAGSINTWKNKRSYIESWWKPNTTKGYLFLEKPPSSDDFLPWPSTSPPYRIYEDTGSRYEKYNRHGMPHAIRMFRVVAEMYKEIAATAICNGTIRWYVMGDDDTVFFLDNLVEVLSKYDHTKYFYVGENSECVLSNFDNSFDMGFGGAGYALSSPLVEALVKNLDVCIKRYPFVYGSDHLLQSCVADLGVSFTHEKGFHQIDLHKDISGLLSAHPQSPFISLHHLDTVDPIFPSMNRSQALNHLMKSAKLDQSRLLQQTICYAKNLSFSTSWGYAVQIYEKFIPPSYLQRPLETFGVWRKPSKQPYMFNTRWVNPNDPCEVPHLFIFEEGVGDFGLKDKEEQIVTSYVRRLPRNLPPCLMNSGPSVGDISKIFVVSPTTRYGGVGTKRECCHIMDSNDKNVTTIKLRGCVKDEIMK